VNVKTWKKEYCEDCPDFLSFTAVLDDRGRITIPSSVRKRLVLDFKSVVFTKVKPLKRRIKK
jgi:bifunctional DNA-binding transcriptional regulator/antitoxin component of YhaV-PrlF toxin-antitoxin module